MYYYITHWFICHFGKEVLNNYENKMTYNHLNKEQRDIIQYMVDQNYSFTQIGKAINKDRTTISKEIKRNRYLKSFTCDKPFDVKNINNAIEWYDYCKYGFSQDLKKQFSEEMSVFYVAITRAKNDVFLTLNNGNNANGFLQKKSCFLFLNGLNRLDYNWNE